MFDRKTVGLLLAAGRGRRMGGNKQFHLVATAAGEKPLVAAAFDTIAHVCDKMIVVVGHRADEVAAILTPRQFEVVEADPDAPMIDSIKAGLDSILSRRATPSGFQNPPPQSAVFPGLGRPALPEGGCLLPSLREGRPLRAGEGLLILQLGDHPALEQATLDQLLEIAALHPDRAVMPAYEGNGGHPVLIPANIAEQILASPCPGGLRQFWLDHPEDCLRVPVNDDSVVCDIDECQ